FSKPVPSVICLLIVVLGSVRSTYRSDRGVLQRFLNPLLDAQGTVSITANNVNGSSNHSTFSLRGLNPAVTGLLTVMKQYRGTYYPQYPKL
ncbi:MAG: hypothetical protein MN733_12420, partial [Nitrososphaera sp.]|nr:hypothetical protein [Nitrososphaera sp.]